MSRLYSLGSWFFTSVALALAVLVPLTVPENAFADSGSCSSYCQYAGTNYSLCMQVCEAGGCVAPSAQVTAVAYNFVIRWRVPAATRAVAAILLVAITVAKPCAAVIKSVSINALVR